MAARILEVVANSIAREVGLEPGDRLLTINGREINDILDYQFYSQDSEIELEVEKSSTEVWLVEIEKDEDKDLGLVFEGIVFDRMRPCRNRCIFCFVDQMPQNLRPTLYIKDDDYRYSFLHGNYITLTNLQESDWEKIIRMRLSPLYVSVHTMDPELRKTMLNNPRAADIHRDLQRLYEAGIEVHTQIVLCPGMNDGAELRKSLEKLAHFYPAVASIGVVPVGLTRFREKLPVLRTCTPEEAREVVSLVDAYQEKFRRDYGVGLVYAADEFYIKAGLAFPPVEYYDDFCQIENGIGLVRQMLDEFALIEGELPVKTVPTEVILATGESALPILQPICERLNQIEGVKVQAIAIKNRFFGEEVTVTGLLTGHDIIDSLGNKYQGKKVVIPSIVCRHGEDVLLDDMTVADIRAQSHADIIVAEAGARGLVQAVLGREIIGRLNVWPNQ